MYINRINIYIFVKKRENLTLKGIFKEIRLKKTAYQKKLNPATPY